MVGTFYLETRKRPRKPRFENPEKLPLPDTDAHPRRARHLAPPGPCASPGGRACLLSDAMSSLADALASLESANACIDAIAGSYPRAFPNVRTSRPIDLTSETARVRRDQQTLQRAMSSENDAPDDARREMNFYVAPGGVLVNAALVPEPEPVPKPEPRKDPPPRASHPPNARVRVGDETHSAEARAVQWLQEQVVPLLPKQHDPKAVFGRAALGLRTFPLDDDDAKKEKDAPTKDATTSDSVGGFHVVDASGASVLRVLLEVREVPSSEGPGTDAAYGPSRPERWGREQWTFSRVGRAARLPSPCVVLLMCADGAARSEAEEAYASGGSEGAAGDTKNARATNAERNAYVAWCVPKENALALRDVLKPYVVVSRRDAACKWRAFRSAAANGGTAAEALASTLARHIDASVASRGQSVALDVPLPGFLRIKNPKHSNKRSLESTSELEPARRRGALLDALGTWSHPAPISSTNPARERTPGSAAPAMAPAWDGLPSATAGSVATLRLDYDLCTSFRVLPLSAVVQAEASWDVAAATLRKPGRARDIPSSFRRDATRCGGFGAPYESTDFDALFVHVGQASRAVGCFAIPVSELVARLHVLGEFERRGKTYACDADVVAPELRLMVPTAASRWRGAVPKAPRGGDAGVVQGQFVDARGAWALDFFVAYPASRDDVAGSVDEVKRLLLGTKPRWDGEWTHPAFRR